MLMTNPLRILLKAMWSNDPRGVHHVHGGGDAHRSEHGLKCDALVGREFERQRHGADGHAFQNGVDAHQRRRVLRACEHDDHGENEAAKEANAHEGAKVQTTVSVAEGVHAQHSGHEGETTVSESKKPIFLMLPSTVMRSVPVRLLQNLLLRTGLLLRISMAISWFSPRSCFNVALAVCVEAPVPCSRDEVVQTSSLEPCTAR